MEPIQKNIPFEIETERLFLCCPKPGDGKAMHQAISDSRDEFQKWFPWMHEPRSLAASEANIRKAQIAFLRREKLPFILWLKEPKALIGRAGFINIDWKIPSFEIGYWLRDSYTGHGYMTEAVSGLTHLAFNTLDARRVEIKCDAQNEKSAAVAVRLGFTLEARHKSDRFDALGETLVDTLVFAKYLRDD